MVVRFEAWSFPWSTTFERLIADLPVVDDTGRGSVRFSEFGEGSLTLPADYPRLSTVVSDTSGSLIRVYDGTDLIHEWVAERVEQSVDADHVNISGPDLAGFAFDRAVVYPYDYPTNPTTQPDWVWGGANSLSNGGFEDSTVTSTVYELTITATGGTYTLSDGTDTTSAIAYNANSATITTRIQTDLGLFDDVVVSASGTSPTKFVITMVDPAYGVNLTIGTGSLTGGTGTVSKTTTGGLSPGSWTIAKTLGSGGGAYTTFTVTDVRAHSGTYSLEVNPAPSSLTSNRWPGAQQVVNVSPGVYQASVWVYPTSGTDTFQLFILGVGEEVIAYSANSALTVNNWNEITISDIEIPEGTTQVIFRLYCTNPGPSDPSPFFVDDAEFIAGLNETTIGDITTLLMDDASSDHSGDTRGVVLDWVDYSGFDATNDSSADAWNEDIALTVHRGMKYGQFLDTVRELGYEWRLVAKATPGATTHDLELYNPGNMDAEPGVGLVTGQAIANGSVVKRVPGYTATLLEGAGNFYDEGSDATAVTNFGRLEKYQANRQWGDTTTMGIAETELLGLESSNRQAIKAELKHGAIRPLVTFTAGDTVSFQVPGVVTKNDRRITQVEYRNSVPDPVFEVTGSQIFPGLTGVYETVRRLARKFRPLVDFPPAATTFEGDGGGMFTIAIAAYNATDRSKDKADYICSGANDQDVINTALKELDEVVTGNGGGRIVFSEGDFHITVTNSIGISWVPTSGQAAFEFVGVGSRGTGHTTSFILDSSSQFMSLPPRLLDFQNVGAATIRNIGFFGNGNGASCAGILTLFTGAILRIVDCYFQEFQTGISSSVSGPGRLWVARCDFDSNATDISGSPGSIIIDNTMVNTSGTANDQASVVVGGQSTPSVETVIAHNNISSCDNYGIRTSGFAHIHHNTINGSDDSAIRVGSPGGIITHNNINNAGFYGIEVVLGNTTEGGLIQGNTIHNSQRHGIFVDQPDWRIFDNRIFGAGQATADTYDGIHIDHDHAHLSRNSIDGDSGQTRYGINIAAGTGSIVVGNDLNASADYGTGLLNDSGTSTVTAFPGGAIGDNFNT